MEWGRIQIPVVLGLMAVCTAAVAQERPTFLSRFRTILYHSATREPAAAPAPSTSMTRPAWIAVRQATAGAPPALQVSLGYERIPVPPEALPSTRAVVAQAIQEPGPAAPPVPAQRVTGTNAQQPVPPPQAIVAPPSPSEGAPATRQRPPAATGPVTPAQPPSPTTPPRASSPRPPPEPPQQTPQRDQPPPMIGPPPVPVVTETREAKPLSSEAPRQPAVQRPAEAVPMPRTPPEHVSSSAAMQSRPAVEPAHADGGPCRSQIFDCAHEEQWPASLRALGAARMNSRTLAILVAEPSPRSAGRGSQRARETAALLFLRTVERTIAGCRLSVMPTAIYDAGIATLTDDPEALVFGIGDGIEVASHLGSLLARAPLQWRPLAQGVTMSGSCAEAGIGTQKDDGIRLRTPQGIIQGKGWAKAMAMPNSEQIALAAFTARQEKVGPHVIREIDAADVLLAGEAGAVRAYRYHPDGLVLDAAEYYPCGGGATLLGVPLPLMIDQAGGPDLAFLCQGSDGQAALHLLPSAVKPPGARIVAAEHILYGDRVCAAGEECHCTWSLKDRHDTDLSFQLSDAGECAVQYGTTNAGMNRGAGWAAAVRQLVIGNALAAAPEYVAQLTVSNGVYSTVATLQLGEQPTAGPGTGEVAPVPEVQSALQAKGILSPTATLIEQKATATVAPEAGGAVAVDQADVAGRSASADAAGGSAPTREPLQGAGGWGMSGGACALAPYPAPLRSPVGLWLIFFLSVGMLPLLRWGGSVYAWVSSWRRDAVRCRRRPPMP